MDKLGSLLDSVGQGFDLIARVQDAIGMSLALVIVAGLFAGIGGFVNARWRLYGAMAGGMIANLALKASGSPFWPAFAAMVVLTAIGFAIGNLAVLFRYLAPRKSESSEYVKK